MGRSLDGDGSVFGDAQTEAANTPGHGRAEGLNGGGSCWKLGVERTVRRTFMDSRR
jgi:hypothetical protein